MEKPVVIYTDHIMNRTLCYNFAKGSHSPMCHIDKFKEYESTIATYGVLRGTFELIKKGNAKADAMIFLRLLKKFSSVTLFSLSRLYLFIFFTLTNFSH